MRASWLRVNLVKAERGKRYVRQTDRLSSVSKMLEKGDWPSVLSWSKTKSFMSQVRFSITLHQCATYFSKPLLNVPCIFRTRRQAESLKWSGVARYGWGGCWFNKSRFYFPHFCYNTNSMMSPKMNEVCGIVIISHCTCFLSYNMHTLAAEFGSRGPFFFPHDFYDPTTATGGGREAGVVKCLYRTHLWARYLAAYVYEKLADDIKYIQKDHRNLIQNLPAALSIGLGLPPVPRVRWDEPALARPPACHLAFPSPSLHLVLHPPCKRLTRTKEGPKWVR